jgi:HEPN domain-containing protein
VAKPLVPPELLDPVVEYFKPQRVILFGSRARGEATRDSDIDLLVIVNDDTPPEKMTWMARHEARRSYHRAADIFPMRAEIFERDRTVVGTLAAEADADGIVVFGSPKGRRMKPASPRTRWAAVERWLAVAERDRKAVLACMAADPPLRDSAAFHCQQALEKLLKRFLTLAGKRSRKTHSLSQLGAAARANFPDVAERAAAAQRWTEWPTAYRHPDEDDPPEPDDSEIGAALDIIGRLAARLQAERPQN